MQSSNPNCTSCGGRGVIANAATGSPEVCPACERYLTGTNGLFFTYLFATNAQNPANVVLTALQAGLIAQVQIANDSNFLCDRFVAASTGTFSIAMTDQFSSRPLQPSTSNPIFGENIAGTAQLPAWLPKPWLLKRTSTVTALFTDRSNAGNTVQFGLVGYKVS
jgi:hypothetical protein